VKPGAATKQLAVVTVAYAVLTFLMALPFSLSPGSLVVSDAPDTRVYIWTLAWDAHAFLHQPLHLFDANIYYPFANTLAYSENLIGTAFFSAPITYLTGNLVLAMNLAALISCVLCGTGAYLLGRRLHLSHGGAFICGLIFAFAPPRFFKLGQLHLTAVQWIPFSLAYLHRYLEMGRRKDLLWAVGFFSLQALASGHGTVYLLVATLATLLWHVSFGGQLAIMQRFRDFGVAGAYLLAPSIWVMLPYRIAQDDAGLRRNYLADAIPGIEEFLASPSRFHMFLQAKLLAPFAREANAYLFPGILVLVLAAIAITRRPDRRALRDNYVLLYLLIGVGATLMFVGWPLELWRHVYWLPGLNFIRIPARFILLTMLALSVLAGFGFDRIAATLTRRGAAVAMLIVSVLLLGEYSSYPFGGQPYAVNPPPIDRWLNTLPKPFVVAEFPVPPEANLGALERQQTQAMMHSTAHWQKTVHGYSSLRRPLHQLLYRQMATFPDATSLTSLRTVGVTYVVVHSEEYGSRWLTVEEQIARTPALKLEHVEGTGRVYSLLPP
jgi:hypothetical protein